MSPIIMSHYWRRSQEKDVFQWSVGNNEAELYMKTNIWPCLPETTTTLENWLDLFLLQEIANSCNPTKPSHTQNITCSWDLLALSQLECSNRTNILYDWLQRNSTGDATVKAMGTHAICISSSRFRTHASVSPLSRKRAKSSKIMSSSCSA